MNLRNSLTLIKKLVFLLFALNSHLFTPREIYPVKDDPITEDVSISSGSKLTKKKVTKRIPFYDRHKQLVSPKAAKIQKGKIKALIKTKKGGKKGGKKNKKKQKPIDIKPKFIAPIKGKISKKYGEKPFKDGIEISSEEKIVKSCLDGKVLYSGKQLPEYQTLVIIKHKNNFITVYGHLTSSNVKLGQKIKQSDQIGKINGTLYLELRKKKAPVDPTKYLKF